MRNVYSLIAIFGKRCKNVSSVLIWGCFCRPSFLQRGNEADQKLGSSNAKDQELRKISTTCLEACTDVISFIVLVTNMLFKPRNPYQEDNFKRGCQI